MSTIISTIGLYIELYVYYKLGFNRLSLAKLSLLTDLDQLAKNLSGYYLTYLWRLVPV